MKIKLAGSIILLALIGAGCNVFVQPTPTTSPLIPTAVISTSIPPTSAVPTATLSASLPGAPTLAPLPQAQATSTVQAPPQAQPTVAPKRIAFASGATSATAQGNLAANGIDVYALRVSGGQTIGVVMSSPIALWLSVNGADGQVLKSMGAGTANWSGVAPITQDYFLTIGSQNGAATSYTLQVTIPPLSQEAPTPTPKRISFAAGATSANAQGALPKNGMDRWIIRVNAGQTMTAKAIPQNGNVMLIVFGVNGDMYQTDHVGSPDFSAQVQTTQDYYIDVRAWGDTAPTYTLQVTIPPLAQPTPTVAPKRISFAAGEIAATVQGALAKNGMDRWIIRAQAGQTLLAKAIPQNGSVAITVFGITGSAIQNDLNSPTDFSALLRTTQDYYINVRALNDTAPTYALQVTIPPK